MIDEDGLALDDVGIWTKEKHERLRKYVDISRGVRKKWVEGTGGATYIDLFCGAGRAVVRETGERIDGSRWSRSEPRKRAKFRSRKSISPTNPRRVFGSHNKDW